LFIDGSKHDLNIRSAFLHLASDAVIALGVVIAEIVIKYTGLFWIDYLLSIVIAFFVLIASWSIFKSSLYLILQGVPEHIDLNKISNYLSSLDGVIDVYLLHVWALSTQETALSAHIIVDKNLHNTDDFLQNTTLTLRKDFAINHSTIQIEYSSSLKRLN
jgi:cobalt-zinc-cadmium efflux system protein